MFDKLIDKVVQLDNDKHYQIIWSTVVEERTFLYLLNINDLSDLLFCEKKSESELEEIKDKEFLRKVILSITKEINIFVM